MTADLTKEAACWNRIGVRGDLSCELLAEHVHCRNCPTYTGSAASLLERAVDADYRREQTVLAAAPRVEKQEKTAGALIFRIGQEWLGVSATVCQELSEQRPTHSIPFRQGGIVLGLVNIRGELVISVSLEKLLSIDIRADAEPERSTSSFKRLVVVQHDGGRYAFPAAEVYGLFRYNPGEVRPLPETLAKSPTHYSAGLLFWNEKWVALLDHELLFYALNKGLG